MFFINSEERTFRISTVHAVCVCVCACVQLMVILMFYVYNSLDLCSFTSVLIWIYICSFMDVMFNQPI